MMLRYEEGDVLRDDLLGAIAEDALGGKIERLNASALVDGDDAVRRRLDDGAHLRLALLQRPLGVFAPRDIGRQQNDAAARSGIPFDRVEGDTKQTLFIKLIKKRNVVHAHDLRGFDALPGSAQDALHVPPYLTLGK